jgi:Ca-activated chloride channel family protein
MRRRGLIGLAMLLAPLLAQAQPRQQSAPPSSPALSASRNLMAGSMLSVLVSRPPAGARLAIARPSDPPSSAIVVVELGGRTSASLPVPGEAGSYELRLTRDQDGAPAILLRQPLVTTPAEAMLAAPDRVGRGSDFPVRGIGPNGERDRVVLVPAGAAADAQGPSFLPQENVEATLEAPERPGAHELRYIMDAPLSGPRILATRPVVVE